MTINMALETKHYSAQELTEWLNENYKSSEFTLKYDDEIYEDTFSSVFAKYKWCVAHKGMAWFRHAPDRMRCNVCHKQD